MNIRKLNKTTIQYVLLTNGTPLTHPVHPPRDLVNGVIDFIKRCPRDLLQLYSSLGYYSQYCHENRGYGYDFWVLNVDNYDKVSIIFNSTPQVQLFFVDLDSRRQNDILKKLRSHPNPRRFFHHYKSPDHIGTVDTVSSPEQFILRLMETSENPVLSPAMEVEHRNFNQFLYFDPLRNNYFTINSIIGNFGYSESLPDRELESILRQHTEEAQKNLFSFDRQKLFIEQIEKLDSLRQAYFLAYLTRVSLEPSYSPMILIFPFHNPDLIDFYRTQELTGLLTAEQTSNYIGLSASGSPKDLLFSAVSFINERVKFLDDIGFLHASFEFSPVIRFPLKGKSMYRDLSFFGPKAFPGISRPENRKRLKKTITRFGKLLTELAIDNELIKLISRRDGQIVAISDLPIEWAMMEGVPLGFTHDICRLPETSLAGLVSLFSQNQKREYSVPENILEKTLVILGTDELEFRKANYPVQSLAEEIGFKLVNCQTIAEVIAAMDEFQPELLVFDCHGGYSREGNSTYLQIGQEKLDGNFVVKHQIVAPLIWLSACGTAPTYGTSNPIANAFFEAGAISVTSTYLPISIERGTLLYYRILRNLATAAAQGIHKNWLQFTAHTMRTSAIIEAFTLGAHKASVAESYMEASVEAVTDSMVFNKRRRLYKTLDQKIAGLTETKRAYYSEVIPEYLMYSNMGRSDMVLFDSWKRKYRDENARKEYN